MSLCSKEIANISIVPKNSISKHTPVVSIIHHTHTQRSLVTVVGHLCKGSMSGQLAFIDMTSGKRRDVRSLCSHPTHPPPT